MKTIQNTLLDELHQRAKGLALANKATLNQFVADAIEAHVVRINLPRKDWRRKSKKPRKSETAEASEVVESDGCAGRI